MGKVHLTVDRAATVRGVRRACGRARRLRERRRACGQTNHPATAKPAGLRRPVSIAAGRSYKMSAREAARGVGRDAASDPWDPAMHLGLFVHRVGGLEPGRPSASIAGTRRCEAVRAMQVSYFQDIAGDGYRLLFRRSGTPSVRFQRHDVPIALSLHGRRPRGGRPPGDICTLRRIVTAKAKHSAKAQLNRRSSAGSGWP